MSDPTQPLGPSARYQQYLDQGEFRLQHCAASGRWIFEPRVAEPVSGATDLEWRAPSGRGRVYAVTVVRPRAPEPPYPVVLVDLEEGVRMMSTVCGVPLEAVRIGLEVRAQVAVHEGRGRLEFVPRP